MEIKELRIGNWYNDKRINRDFVVYEIRRSSIDHGDSDYSPTSIANAKGIELTDEWLHNFGFDIEWTIGGFLKWEKQMPYKEKFKLMDRRLPHPQHHEPKAMILYVHQLQNLFFALTGRELELKK